MESNNDNIEMILNSLDMTNENVLQAEILTQILITQTQLLIILKIISMKNTTKLLFPI